MAKLKALVWDLDGTIVDSFAIFKEVVRDLADKSGLARPTDQAFRDNYHGTLDDAISGALNAALDAEQLKAFIDTFLSVQNEYYYEAERHVLEDALDLSKRASSLKLKQVIVTNREHVGRGHASPRSIVATTSLNDHIHEIICGDEVDGNRKPDPKVLGDLLERWGMNPEELLVIGDQHVDAQLALNLGCKAAIVLRDGGELVHAHRLDKNWQDHVTIVQSLKEVKLS